MFVVAFILQYTSAVISAPNPLVLGNVKQYIFTGTQIVTGLIIATSLYYIGKMHDRRKDYIQYLGDVEEHSIKVRRWLQQSNNENIRLVNTMDDLYSYFEQVQNRLPSTARYMIRLTLLTIAFLIWGIMAISFDRTDLGSTIFTLTVMSIGGYFFIVFWLLYDNILSVYDGQLRILSNFVGVLKSSD